MSNTNQNAAGLQPSESKGLAERSMQPHEEEVVQGIKEMYACAPKENTFSIYTSDAVFEDPVGIAKGPKSIKAQFVGLTKLFPRADITKFRILTNPSTLSPNTLLIDQDVAYFRSTDASAEPTKVVNSLLTLDMNDMHKVKHHTEEWDHSKSSTSDDGFLGMLNEQRKKGTAVLTEKVVGKDT